MHIDRQIAIWAGWIAGPAFGIAMMAAPEYLKLEPLVAGLLFRGGIAVFLLTIIVVLILWLHETDKQKAMLGPILTMFVGALVFCGGASWYFWPTRLGFVDIH
jgi:drug/metabolite transporter (DMT)-like permease